MDVLSNGNDLAANRFTKSFGGAVARIDGWAWIAVFVTFATVTVVAVVAAG
jgi:hypothetical protein